jgi:hypothetical protein
MLPLLDTCANASALPFYTNPDAAILAGVPLPCVILIPMLCFLLLLCPMPSARFLDTDTLSQHCYHRTATVCTFVYALHGQRYVNQSICAFESFTQMRTH